MKNDGHDSSGGGFWGLLFAAAWLLFGWPMVTVAGDGPGLFAYFFVSAGAVVAVLYFASKRSDGGNRED